MATFRQGKAVLFLIVMAMLLARPAVADDRQGCIDKWDLKTLAACTRAIESGKYLGGSLAVLYFNRGAAHQHDLDYDRAIADYSEAIRLNSDYSPFYYARGNSRRARGDNDRAIADYSEAIRLDPKYAMSYLARGWAKRQKGDAAGADADVAKANTIQPGVGR